LLLEGDNALVTGAGNGIGRGIADALEKEGAKVFRADLAQADLSRPEGAAKLAEEAIRALKKVSIYVHCASPRRQESQTIKEVKFEEWREMLAVNLDAAFLISQKLSRHMIAEGVKGRILLITSLHAESPRNLPHYSASKAGQTMLVKELARALGPHGIRVNAIAPGWIESEMLRNALAGDEQRTQKILQRTPMNRFGDPSDIGWAAVYLCSPAARFITGVILPVDGGASATL
jgi:3-oxoacyl-[acyl-carrier protein] reductase